MKPLGELGKGDALLAQIAVLNQRLLTSAQKGDWQRVRALERERRVLVRNLFAGRLDAAEPQLIRCVQEIVQVDREIVKLTLIQRRGGSSGALKSSAK